MDHAEIAIYLAGCALNGTIPEKSRLEGVDMAGLHAEASRHMVAAIVGYALELAGIKDETFTQARAKALRKAVIQDSDLRKISAGLEEAGIWHVPLKGAVLGGYYPAFGLREMSDVDILFDSSRARDVRRIMEGLGFPAHDFGTCHHDTYHRPPVSSIEMHRVLVYTWINPAMCDYFADVSGKLIHDGGKKYTCHFSPEDFYLHMTAHTYMHYMEAGTGLRSLLDEYVYMRKFADSMDWDYISREAGKMNIAEFEEGLRSLAMSVFGGHEVRESDREMLRQIMGAGVYGYRETYAQRLVEKACGGSRLRFILMKLFPPFSTVKYISPLVYKHKYLYPLFLVKRFIKAVTVSRKRVMAEIRGILRKRRE